MYLKKTDAYHCLKKLPDEMLQECYRNVYETDINMGCVSIGKLTRSMERRDAEMKSDRIFMSEVNADLWGRALVTAIGDINHAFYPHPLVVQKLVNYTLNSPTIDIGLTRYFFTKLLLFHPPKSYDLQKYYWSFLEDTYLELNPDKEEEDNAFWCLINVLSGCLTNEKCNKGFLEESFEGGFLNSRKENMDNMISLTKKILEGDGDWTRTPEKKEKVCFESLSPSVQVQRVLMVLEFLCTILDINFKERIRENSILSYNECFLSVLLWENPQNLGMINGKVKKLIYIWFALEKANFCNFLPIHRKLLVLLSEIIHRGDAAEEYYPFLGQKSHSLAREISLKLNDCLKENMRAVRGLKPHWLRMLVCCRLLHSLTGNSCPPELVTAHDILKFIANIRGNSAANSKESKDKRKRRRRMSGDIRSCICMVAKAKRAKLPVKVDINSYNSRGWTMLHEAVLNRHEKCVESLLKDEMRPVDTKLKGIDGLTPLMCAVATNHAGITRRLLQHSGRELLTDVDDSGRTPMDLCRSKDISDVLVSFESTFSIKNDDLELSVDLCVQLVESYFITHRTWDLWKCRSRTRKSAIMWDRVRYETDVHTNVDKLAEVVTKLMEWKELTRLVEPLKRVLSFKKCL